MMEMVASKSSCQSVRSRSRSNVMGGWQTDNIVSTWLRFLQVGEYSENFLDNGYDDLETVKQIGEEDLKAIGVDNQDDEEVILLSVKVLREQGAAWVYLLSEDNYQEVMSSTSDPSSTSLDTFRQRLRPAESSEESIEPLSVCDDIYCDISEEISSRPDSSSSWTGFWRRWGRGEARRETRLKKDPTFERLKSILSPDGRTVISKISGDSSSSRSLLSSLVRPLHYRTIKLSTPLITRRETARTGREIEL